ncbi:MAG: phosphoribosylaminoimidazolesuccinocarboxamide synthase [Patescibacteria group bacterium]|jgi:phosphoribosylaminoimidazole-succinocarboxamide synthase
MDKSVIEKNLNKVLDQTDFKNLGERRQGKARDIYTQPDKIILIATDRYSAFDYRNLALIPFKGEVLTQTSRWWFERTADIVPNHVIDFPDPRVVVAKKCRVIPLEMVVRGYICGVTDTSLWTHYQKGKRDFGDFILSDGMVKNQKLENPVLTPTTKSEEHDRPISAKEIFDEGIVSEEVWKKISSASVKLYERGLKLANERGLILVDTKYEFGMDEEGNVMLIDEIHTPDSSRYWKLNTYNERFSAGLEPEYFDKEFLRLWFKANCDPYNDPVLPKAPDELVAEISSRYIQIYEQISGEQYKTDIKTPILERIEKNLSAYRI